MAKPKDGSGALHDVHAQQLGEAKKDAAESVKTLNASLDQANMVIAAIDAKKGELKTLDEEYASAIKVLEQRRLTFSEEIEKLDRISQGIYRAMQQAQKTSEKLQELASVERSS